MKELFIEQSFKRKTLERIAQANKIIYEYQADGFTLTLRQLYYQFVARGLIENTQRKYDSLGDTISKARLGGLIDWDAIEDRTRFLRGRNNSYSPSSAIYGLSHRYSVDMWTNQETRIEVWIEKDALLGVVEKVCADNDVNYFACRGYVSQSALYEAGKRMTRYQQDGFNTVIIHLGDHDPSGIDMTRDNRDRVNLFERNGTTLHRIALNRDQVDKYGPPPNPAKMSDSRAADYVAEYGTHSWELDALEPRVIRKLIQDEIDTYKDPNLWQVREDLLAHDRETIAKAVSYVEERQQKDRS
jgi:hypothetical protein